MRLFLIIALLDGVWLGRDLSVYVAYGSLYFFLLFLIFPAAMNLPLADWQCALQVTPCRKGGWESLPAKGPF
jgi:hypothetical protein